MEKTVYLTPEAIRALITANLAGPNCRRKNAEQLVSLFSTERNTSLVDLSRFFEFGPTSFLVSYAVLHKKEIIDIADIAKSYCIDHISTVQVAEICFYQKGFAQDYFRELEEASFELSRKNLSRFLFSCVGKIGVVEKKENEFYQIRISVPFGEVIAKNVFCPFEISKGQKVALHYAAVFASLDENAFKDILKQQKQKEWFENFKRIKRIDYTKWLKGNLTKFTQQEFQKLPRK